MARSRRLTLVLDLKDRMSNRISKVTGSLDRTRRVTDRARDSMGKFTRQGDRAASMFRRFRSEGNKAVDGVSSKIKGLIATMGLLAAANSGFKAIFGGASQIEQEKISMEHFIGLKTDKATAKKQTEEYVGWLRKNANETPFDTGEVLGAGRRAVNVSGGDIAMAKELLMLSENMAALNPGKSVMDAMEALADMKVGETERMKEFGFKISQKDLKAAGGGNVETGAMRLMLTDVAKTFEGGAQKLATSAKGYVSTISGSISSGFADMGAKALEKSKPMLKKVVDLVSSEGFNDFVEAGSKVLSMGIDRVAEFVAWLGSLKPMIKQVGDFVRQHWSIIEPMLKGIAVALTSLFLIKKVLSIINLVKGALLLLTSPIGIVVGLIAFLYTAWENNWFGIREIVSGFIEWVTPYLQSGFTFLRDLINGIMTTLPPIISQVWNFIKNVIKSVIDFLAPYFTQYAVPAFRAIITAVRDIYNYVIVIFPLIWAAVKNIFDIMMPYIQAVGEFIWTVLKSAFDIAVAVVSTSVETIWNVVSTVFEFVSGIFKAFMQFLSGDFSGAWETLKETIGNTIGNIGNIIGDFISGAIDVGKKFMVGIKDGLLAGWKAVKNVVGNIWDAVKGIFSGGPDPEDVAPSAPSAPSAPRPAVPPAKSRGNSYSHASGISRVPYDGYQATLHKGERVLTPEENRSSRGNINIEKLAENLIIREEADIDKVASLLAKKLNEAWEGS